MVNLLLTHFTCAMLMFISFAGLAAADESTKDSEFDGRIEIPGSDWYARFGGFLRLDMIYDFDAIGSTDSFKPNTIPTDGSDGSNSRLHAKWTRLHAELGRSTDMGPARIYVETDFFDDGNALRMRHAYAEVGSLLVGQTWSTFMDEAIIPPTIDLEEPAAFVFDRVAMVRWTRKQGENVEWNLAIEDPDGEIEPPDGVTGNTEFPLPNFVARFRWDDGNRHLQLSGFAGKARFRAASGEEDDVSTWGLNLSGGLTVFGRDRIRAQVAYGPGIASFRGGITGAPDANDQIEGVDTFATMLSYQHYWRDDLYTHVIYSYGEEDNTAGQADDSPHALEYAAANLVWEFTDKVFVGGEWLYGTREDNDGASGSANRLLIAVWMNFF
jgi:hypothetical protein